MIKINQDKAIKVAQDKIRLWRDSEFSKNDLAIQNALVDGSDMSELVKRRDYLRDLPRECEGKTIEELLELIKNIEVENDGKK